MERENHVEETDNSRRSFMKKGALASSAVALGLAGSGSIMGDLNLQEEVGNALVFAYDYHPELPFQVVSGLQQPTINSILGQQLQDGNPPVSDPTDYNGYVVRYQTGTAGIYALLFIQDVSLQTGTTYRFTGNVGFFNTEISLVSAGVATGGGGETPEERTTTPANETTTTPPEETTTTQLNETTTTPPEETPTEQVVVNATETEGG